MPRRTGERAQKHGEHRELVRKELATYGPVLVMVFEIGSLLVASLTSARSGEW